MVGAGEATPALVENVETLANVAHVVARGPSWFRTEGTDASPGTVVCTVTGAVGHAAVGEVLMGTPLREVLEEIGGPPPPGGWKAVLAGVSNAVITADQLDVPVSYEGLSSIGAGLGSAGFLVYGEGDDMVGLAAGVSSFLAVESCGQCRPCKVDGLRIAELLTKVAASQADERDVAEVHDRLRTVTDGARCYLATQQQVVVGSLVGTFADEVEAHLAATAPAVEPTLVAELRDIVDETAVWDERHREKQPDWSYDPEWSGAAPVERFAEHRPGQELPLEPDA
jgi:NADH:ubiquinone oxidoreductase subunit F (NADH-binding)